MGKVMWPEVVGFAGTVLAVWALYRLSPELGRTVLLVGSIALLLALVAVVVRRHQRS